MLIKHCKYLNEKLLLITHKGNKGATFIGYIAYTFEKLNVIIIVNLNINMYCMQSLIISFMLFYQLLQIMV